MRSGELNEFLVIVGIILVGILGIGFAVTSSTPPIDRLNATVLLTHEDFHGSGVMIGSRHILTNAHVVPGTTSAVEYRDGRKEEASLVWKATNADLALLVVKTPFDGWVPKLDCEAQEVGEAITAIGHPYSTRWMMSSGHISTDRVIKTPDGLGLPADISLNPGNSGGPIFNSSGDLVGLAVGILGKVYVLGAGISIIIPGSEICKALASEYGK